MFQFKSLNLLGKRYSQCFVSAEQQIQRVSSWHCYLQTVIHWLDLISEKMGKHDCTWHPDSLCCQKHPEYGASWIFRRIKLYQATQPDHKFCIFQSFMKWPFLRSHSDVRGCFWRPAPLLQIQCQLSTPTCWCCRGGAGGISVPQQDLRAVPHTPPRLASHPWAPAVHAEGQAVTMTTTPLVPQRTSPSLSHSCKMPPSALPGDPAG